MTGEKVIAVRLQFSDGGTVTATVEKAQKGLDATAQSAGRLYDAQGKLVKGNEDVARTVSAEAAAIDLLNSRMVRQVQIAGMQLDHLRLLTAQTTALGSAHRSNANDTETSSAAMQKFGDVMQGVTNYIKAFVVAWAFRKGIDELKELVMEGVHFNAQLEQSKLGLGALTMTFGQVYDAQGKLLTGTEAYNASLKIGADMQEQLKTRALGTTLQYSELLDVMQRGMPYMLAHLKDKDGYAVDNAKLVDFAATFAQGAHTAGLDPSEIGVNIQKFLQGTADPRHARFAAMLQQTIGPTPEAAREQMKIWEDQGVLYDKLMEKLKAFKLVGEDAMNTYSGALSNLKDAWQQLLGKGTEGATSGFTKDMLELRDALVTIDANGHAAFNPEFVDGIRGAADAMASLAKFGVQVVEFFPSLIDETRAYFEAMSRIKNWVPWGDAATSSGLQQESMDRQRLADRQTAMNEFAKRGSLIGWRQGNFQNFPGGSEQFFDAIGAAQRTMGSDQFSSLMGQVDILGNKNGKRSLNYMDFSSMLQRAGAAKFGGYKIKTNGTGGDDGDPDGLASFREWMAKFHAGADDTGGDKLAEELNTIAGERDAAIQKLKEKEKKLGDVNEDWKKDLADINATFDNKNADAMSKYADSFAEAMKKFDQYNLKAGATDPLSQALAGIQSKRAGALFDVGATQNKFPEMSADWTGLKKNINDFFDHEMVDAALESTKKINDQTLQETRKTWDMRQQIDIERQSDIDKERVSHITDSIAAELDVRLRANQRWSEDEQRKIEETYKDEQIKAQALGTLSDWLKQKNEQAYKDAEHARNAQIVGTTEWLEDLKRKVNDTFPAIGVTIEQTLVGSMTAVNGAFEQFFNNLEQHQHHMGKVIDDLGTTLASGWSKVLGDMMTNTLIKGQSITQQLSQIKNGLTAVQYSAGGNVGSVDWSTRAFTGAGLGSFVGGMFGGPNNYGQLGGSLGGALGGAAGSTAMMGALLGSWAPVIGTVVGLAIGTLIGSMIQKGKDSIQVAIKNISIDALRGDPSKSGGTTYDDFTKLMFGPDSSINVTEKGIDYTTRNDLIVQIRRQVKDTMKGYQSIIDLFPDEFQKQIADLKPTLNLTGGAESKDITDEGAMSSLSDFLNNKLPKAAFEAYKPALSKGLAFEGLNEGKIAQLFEYWGTLQGQELHDAVMKYVTTIVSFADVRGKLNAPFQESLDAAKNAAAQTGLSKLKDGYGEIAVITASLPKLVDVEDQAAAMDTINSRTNQWYLSMLQYLEHIDEVQKAYAAAFDRTREQIKLAGMDDQGKVNYYYAQLAKIREQLMKATDPDEIQRLTNLADQYTQAALGLAPDNSENRDKLTSILDDLQAIADKSLEAARKAVGDEQARVAKLLNDAAEALLKAANKLNPDDPAHTNPPDPGTDTPIEHGPFAPAVLANINTFDTAIQSTTAALTLLRNEAADLQDGAPRLRRLHAAPDATQVRADSAAAAQVYAGAIATEMKRQFSTLEFKGTTEQPIVIVMPDGSQLEETIFRDFILMLKDNPDLIRPRTG